ncbi:unnamed protein product [Effrenium voratum]|nr:unnamed protein product [Effrenium voratum]
MRFPGALLGLLLPYTERTSKHAMELGELQRQLAPTGKLRAGINLANFLLVTGRDPEPAGVSPDVAAEIAKRLGVEVQYVAFNHPKELADAVDAGSWDIGLVGAEPQREAKIAFSAPYADIPAMYLVPGESNLTRKAEVDSPGVRIASVGGSAFGLWLEKNIQNATLLQVPTMDEALELLVQGKVDVLASLKERLLSDVQRVPKGRILEGSFMTATWPWARRGAAARKWPGGWRRWWRSSRPAASSSNLWRSTA